MAENMPEPGERDRLNSIWCAPGTAAPGLESHRYRLMVEITDLVVRAASLPDLFKELAPLVLALTNCSFVNFSLYDERQNCMLTHYWKRNQESGELDAFAVDHCVSGWVWTHQEPLTMADINCEDRFPFCLPVLRHHEIRSYSMLPMTTPFRRYGALGLGKDVPEVLDGHALEFLSWVALMAALALENQGIHRAWEEQQSLVAIGRELSSSLDLDRLLPVILSSLRSITRYDHAVLSVLEEDGDALQIHALEAPGWERFLTPGQRIPLDQATSAQAIRTRSITFFTAEDLRDMGKPLAKAMCDSGVRSLCNVPLVAGNRVWGSLSVGSMGKKAFSPKDGEYLQQVANQISAAIQNAHAYREIAQLKEQLAQENRDLKHEIRSERRHDEIVGNSLALKRVLDHASIVANTDSTVLITGETGTGKEQVARAIHTMSRRKDRSFIKLNCAAIPTGLLESELFGHEKGAFTGAVSQKLGRLELADKGTLFLDEVGEIPLEMQPKLLRVLQDHEFERLGGTRTIRVDVRLIAATNRDLARAVEEKEFRSDLFYRLHVFPLHMPALRDRREDIPLLVRHFVEKCAERLNKRIEFIPDEAIEAMLHWSWPGNIRELENFVERSVILSPGNTLRVPLAELRRESARSEASPDGTLRGREREHIVEVLRQSRGLLSGPGGAAACLGLKRTTLQYKMQKLGISRLDYLG
jgi:formate hydrogenlyase transcriptional activator